MKSSNFSNHLHDANSVQKGGSLEIWSEKGAYAKFNWTKELVQKQSKKGAYSEAEQERKLTRELEISIRFLVENTMKPYAFSTNLFTIIYFFNMSIYILKMMSELFI